MNTKKCKQCGKEFEKGYNISKNAWVGSQRRPKGVQYCSRECANRSMDGHVPWNKGKFGLQKWTEKQRKHIRNLWIEKREKSENYKYSGSKWQNTRKTVLERDDYICQECGYREPVIMVVDHIRPKSLFPELTYKMSNCMTLCPNCHTRKSIEDKKLIREILKNKE